MINTLSDSEVLLGFRELFPGLIQASLLRPVNRSGHQSDLSLG